MKDDAWNDGFDDCMEGKGGMDYRYASPREVDAYISGYSYANAYRHAIRARPAEPRDTEIADLKEWTK